MATITAIIDKTTPGDKIIKLFYSTGKAQLGLAVFSGTKDEDPEDSIQTPQEVGNDQYILNPSHMASVNFQGVERVFALTTANPFKVTADDTYTLSEVSPSYHQRSQDIKIGNTTLASCTSGDNAWVYISEPHEDSRILLELNLETWETNRLSKTNGLWINAFAAAWYNTKTRKRSVIYESSALWEYVVDDATLIPIGSTGDMQRNTPVAVAFNAGTVYLYYCGTGTPGGIRRTIKTNNIWAASTPIENIPTIAQDSQLTVVRANGINHLFYAARDQNEAEDVYFVHHRDEVK